VLTVNILEDTGNGREFPEFEVRKKKQVPRNGPDDF
jgi:hypothetical protein